MCGLVSTRRPDGVRQRAQRGCGTGAGGEALAFHRLEVPATLNTTFLSTNLIENVLRNWREATGNVKRWNEKQDMVPRWMAAGLLWAEVGFRKIRHAEALPRLAAALSLCAPSDGAEQEQPCQNPTA